MNRLYSLFLILFIALNSSAQDRDFSFGEFSKEERKMTAFPYDTSANAVVLREYGKALMTTTDRVVILFDYHVRIKVLKDAGDQEGNIIIPLKKSDNDTFETIDDIKGFTEYKDENGLTRRIDLDPKQVFKENKNRYSDLVKFALPNVKAGSIIEYQYRITSPYIFNFREWQFQAKIPKITSEFIAVIPAKYEYNVILKGFLKVRPNEKGEILKDAFLFGGNRYDCSHLVYAMDNIPAFKSEDKMTAESNFMSAISFELAQYYGQNNIAIKVTKDWSSIDHELKTSESFGAQLKKGALYNDVLESKLNGIDSPLARARIIYDFFQHWFKWNKYVGIFTQEGLKKSLSSHSGSVADINLGLIAALNTFGLSADPVLLSTRDNGLVNSIYPNLTDFNYVIARVMIGEQAFLLDATDPLMPFGLVPLHCLNGKGRVWNAKNPSYWIDIKPMFSDMSNVSFILQLAPDGVLKGKMIRSYMGYSAYNKRIAIKKFNSDEEYWENEANKLGKIKVLHTILQNKDSIDLPLREVFDVVFPAVNSISKSRIVLNPFFADRISKNPFSLEERSYPVDFGAPTESRMLITVDLPGSYVIDGQPENVNFALPDKGGRFYTSTQLMNGQLAFMQLIQFNKSVYMPEEYPYVKELYNRIIEFQKKEIVLQKTETTPSVATFIK